MEQMGNAFFKKQDVDVEKILGINYISEQELPHVYERSEQDVLSDKLGEWEIAVVIIKHNTDLSVTRTSDLNIQAIVSYGKDILPLLKGKP